MDEKLVPERKNVFYRLVERGKEMYRDFKKDMDLDGILEELNIVMETSNRENEKFYGERENWMKVVGGRLDKYLHPINQDFSIREKDEFYGLVSEIRENVDSFTFSENQKKPFYEFIEDYSKRFEACRVEAEKRENLNQQIRQAQGIEEDSGMSDIEKMTAESEKVLKN